VVTRSARLVGSQDTIESSRKSIWSIKRSADPEKAAIVVARAFLWFDDNRRGSSWKNRNGKFVNRMNTKRDRKRVTRINRSLSNHSPSLPSPFDGKS